MAEPDHALPLAGCYGKYCNQKQECTLCKMRKYCAEAGDPPLYTVRSPPPAIVEKLAEKELRQRRRTDIHTWENRRYSRNDLLEVIGFMAALDRNALDLIELKLGDPTLRLSELAATRKVSRQALHRMVTQRLSRIPELASIITYHKHRNKVEKEKSFLEEVCQIRRKVRAKQSKQPKPASNCLRVLSCSNRNTLSSPTNIFSGDAIWRIGSAALPPREQPEKTH